MEPLKPTTDCYYVLDLDSGTYFSLERAVVLDIRELTDSDIETLENGSDMTRSEVGDDKGKWLPVLLGLEVEDS